MSIEEFFHASKEKYRKNVLKLLSDLLRLLYNKKRSKCYLKKNGYDFQKADLSGIIYNNQRCSQRFSIIVPVYNAETYLRRCLDSLINQEFEGNYEIICVNDGSIDGSLSIIKSYGNRIKIINQENQGISKSRNIGIRNSTGEYIILVDNDDYLVSNFLEEVDNFIKKTNSDFVQTSYSCVDKFDTKIGFSLLNDRVYQNANKEMITNTRGYIWGCAIKRSIFEQIRFPEGFWYEDMITKMVIMRFCKRIGLLSKILYNYRVHETNASKTLWKSKHIKTTDQLWLAIQLNNYCLAKGKLTDEYSYSILLEEFGRMLWWRTKELDFRNRISVFFLASDYLKKMHYYSYSLTKQEAELEKCLLKKDYMSWLVLFE